MAVGYDRPGLKGDTAAKGGGRSAVVKYLYNNDARRGFLKDLLGREPKARQRGNREIYGYRRESQ